MPYRSGRRGLKTKSAPLLAVVGILAVGGCSSVPDAVNPVSWYRGVESMVSGSDKGAKGDEKPKFSKAPGESEEFPKVASVPERPRLASDREERESATRRLLADRKEARYTDDEIRRQTQDKPIRATVAPGKPSTVSSVVTAPTVAVQAAPLPAQAVPAPIRSVPVPQASQAVVPRPVVSSAPPSSVDFERRTGISPAAGAPAQPSQRVGPGTVANSMPPVGTPPYEEKAGVVLFDVGSAQVNSAARAKIARIAATFRSRGGILRVVGHASSRTRDMKPVRHHMVNFGLSLDRANAVVATLMQMGIPADRLRVDARGDASPIYQEVMPAGEAGNRRAEIFFIGGAG